MSGPVEAASRPAFDREAQPTIRVQLLEGLTQTLVEGLDLVVVDGETWIDIPVLTQDRVMVVAASIGMTVDGRLVRGTRLMLWSPSVFLKVDGREYRELLEIRLENGTLSVINHVGLETYLGGTVAAEMPAHWPMEALKAQAIVSRSYAWAQMRSSKNHPFDVVSDVRHQVYPGSSADKVRSVKAVRLTRGIILTLGGEPVETFFHSSCGGSTEVASNVWPNASSRFPSVACGFCTLSPAHDWKLDVPVVELTLRLRPFGFKGSTLEDIYVLSRSESGRALSIRLSGTMNAAGDAEGDAVVLDCNTFRRIVGYSRLKSCRFTSTQTAGRVTFRGQGYGHGVGMCQWGARGMALKKWTAERILEYYYPGTQRTRLQVPANGR